MKKFNNFSILRQGKLFLLALLAWFAMQPAWSQESETTESGYLGFTATEGNTTVRLIKEGNPYNASVQYRINNAASWTDYTYGNNINLKQGDKVEFKAKTTNSQFSKSYSYTYAHHSGFLGLTLNDESLDGDFYYFSFSNYVEGSGNVTSLLNPVGTDVVPANAFVGLFKGCDKLLSAPSLPSKTLGTGCYAGMFYECTSLQSAPELPATTLKDGCYAYMFAGCEKLQSIKVGFTAWNTNATKDWVRTTYDCALLGDKHQIRHHFSSTGGTFYKESTLSFVSGDSNIPTGWILATDKDYLLFTWNSAIANADIWEQLSNLITSIFGGSTSKDISVTLKLNQSDELKKLNTGDINGIIYNKFFENRPLQYSFSGAPETSAWTDWDYKNGATIKLKYGQSCYIRSKNANPDVEKLKNSADVYVYFSITPSNDAVSSLKDFTDGIICVTGNIMSLLDKNCTCNEVPEYGFYNLFKGADCIFNAPTLPATDLNPHCYESMFEGCTKLNAAPNLPATTEQIEEAVAEGCYNNMFKGCSKIDYIKVGFNKWIFDNLNTTNSTFQITSDWVNGVTTSGGTFRCPDGLNLEYSDSRIPTSWRGSSNVGPVDEKKDWLCFELTSNFGTVKLDRSSAELNNLTDKLQYSFTGTEGSWKNYTWADKKGQQIDLNAKEGYHRVYFRSTVTDNSGRCSENNALSGPNAKFYQFAFSGNFNASGNIMSLLRKDCKRYSVGDYEFFNLFSGCRSLKTAPSLPATILGISCYERMFQDCAFLAAPPALPAENLNDACYKWMFLRCTTMTYAPDLPAMVLKPSCYYQMFGNCENITSAPVLPATNLVNKCYERMFLNCKNLSFISVYFLNWDNANTIEWVKGVSTTGDFYCPDVLPEEFGENRIPYDNNNKWRVHDNTNVYLYFEAKRNGSTIQLNKNGNPDAIGLLYSTDNGATWHDYTWTTATEGLKIALNKSGANRVFFKAGKTSDPAYTSNLTFSNNPNGNRYQFVMKGSFSANGNIMSLLSQDLSLDEVPSNAFGRLFQDCAVMTTAPTLPAKTVGASAYQYMFLRCKSLQTPPELPAENLGNNCYFGMFMQCFNLKKAPELNATKLANSCYYQMFKNDTALTVAPTLPATELKPNCYQEMFRGCKNLQYMNVAFKDWDPSNATTNWVADGDDLAKYPFHNTGIFMCPNELAANPVYGPNRIPKDDTYQWHVNVAALRFTAENGGATIKLYKNGAPTSVSLEYSLDNAISWNDIVFGEEVSVAKGQSIFIRAKENVNSFSTSANDYYQFVIDGTMSVSGDVTLLYNTSGNITSIPNYTFYKLFSGCAGLKNIPTLTRPNIPIGKYSHAYMFENCSSITEAPDSLALTLTEGCYKGMLKGCSSIKTAPVLPATTLVDNCYEEIFQNCSSLSEITVGFTSWPNNQNYTNNWATNVYKTGIFFCPESVANKFFGTHGIPYDNSNKWDVNPTFLKFTASTAATVELDRVGMPDTVMLTYSTDLRTWLNYSWEGEQGKKINLAAGKSLYFRAKDTNATFSQSEEKFYQFKIEGEVAVAGYATYLLSKTNNSATVPAYGFYGLFKDCSTITSAPAPTASTNEWSALNAHCYESMYEGCSSITTIPCELPCKQLNVACYKNMFKGCTNLIATMATLPAPSNLTESCYEGMFEGCESITTAPDVAWTNNPGIATFKAMFKGCKALVNNLPSSLASGNVVQESCYESLFEGCESMNTKIDLPSVGLKKAVYKAMFKDCKSLTSDNLPELGFANWAIVEGESALESMFEGCESLTTPVVIRDVANWSQYPKAIMRKMFKGCTNLTTPLTLPLATIGEACFESMFEGCESLTKAPQLPQTNLAKDCYKRMFMDCTSLKRAPQLPAKTDQLQDSCYAYMFNGCTSLRYIDVAFNKWFDDPDANFDDATYMWVENVAPTGTFMCPFELDKTKVDASHIPSGWSADDNGNYLYIAKTNGGNFDVFLSKQGNPNDINYQFSLDKKTWTSFSTDIWNNNKILTGDNTIVYIKCAEGVMSKDADNYWFFSTTGNVKIGGNITSLLDASMEQTDVPDYAFYKLFSGCPNISDISELELPATEVGAYAYANMFEGCTYLQNNSTVAPELPATTLGNYCYQNLFKGWKKLQVAPALPAKTLAEGCYSNMFNGCTDLKSVSALPATELQAKCYESMFAGCSKLDSLNVAFTTWSPASATNNWVAGVSDEGNFVCPWALAQDAISKSGNNLEDAYGESMIPKDHDHPWLILLVTDMEFDYKTGTMTIAGRKPITYTTDPSLTVDNRIGTTVDEASTTVDLKDWLNDASITDLDSITYYAIAGESMNGGKIKPTVNKMTIYRYPKKIGMCICDNETRLKKALYYANKVSSPRYPIKLFIPDGTYTLDETLVVSDSTISLIGESLNGTILKSSAPNGVFKITGDNVYMQDMKLVNTASGAAFTNRSLNTTMRVAIEGYYIEAPGGVESKRYALPEATWNRATDPTQATIASVTLNGSTLSIIPGENNTSKYVVRMDEAYAFATSQDFFIMRGLEGKNVYVRAVNARGALGEPVVPNKIEANGSEYTELTVKLNGNGFCSFSFDDPLVDQLQVIGASAYKGVYHEGAIYLSRLNEHDIVPRNTGVILVGLPNATLQLYLNNTDVNQTPYSNVTEDNIPLTGNCNETIQRHAGDGKYYYVLSGNVFKKLSDKGTLKPNKAYFDLTGKVDAGAANIRIIFGMWEEEEEEVVSGINYLPTAGNDSEYSYMLTGVRMKDAKGLVIQNNKVVLIK